MNNDLFINELIEWIDESEENLIERVLWIDEGYSIAFVLDIKAQKGLPELKKFRTLEKLLMMVAH